MTGRRVSATLCCLFLAHWTAADVGQFILFTATLSISGERACGCPNLRMLTFCAPLGVVTAVDIHYDPYFGNSTYGFGACNQPGSRAQFGCDSPLDLVTAAFANAATTMPNPDFILFAGDSVRHDGHLMPDPHRDIGNVLNTVRNLTHQHFPGTQVAHGSLSDPHIRVVQSIGNNDVELDYVLRVSPAGSEQNPQLLLFANEWSSPLNASQYGDLSRGGFYEQEMVPGLRVLSINTIIYSVNHCNQGPYPNCIAVEANDADPTDPLGQFAWLEQRLNAADVAGAKVYILGHIPPTIESYGPRHSFWKQPYIDAFLNVTSQWGAVIEGLLFGHLHSDEWRGGPSLDAVGQPILISSSITPIYDNNPSFKVVSYDRDSKAILDYQVFSTPILSGGGFNQTAPWELLFTLSSLTGRQGVSLPTMNTVARSLPHNVTAFNLYYQREFKAGVAQASCDAGCVHGWSCLLGHTTAAEYTACLAGPTGTPTSPAPLSPGHTPSPTTPATTTPPTSSNGSSPQGKGSGAAVVAAGAVAAVLVVVAACALLLWRRYFGKRRHHYVTVQHDMDGEAIEMENLLATDEDGWPERAELVSTGTNTEGLAPTAHDALAQSIDPPSDPEGTT